ncbi:hypothetical protein V6R21_19680 [Limibacter armeniacum]|uniref:hypothetical protein n=1 Tax=Limibacter armeniacum TaxID=466084 RepID=UPI002FE52B39
MKTLTLTLFIFLTSFAAFSQDFKIPTKYTLETEEDYDRYETDALACINFLLDEPYYRQDSERQKANKFVVEWLSGSPKVHIGIDPRILTFIQTSPEMLVIFMGGWAKYSLESKDFDNTEAGNLAGIQAVIDFYTKNKPTLNKDKNIEKYIKLAKKGKLKDFISQNA